MRWTTNDIDGLERAIGYTFKDKRLIERALTRRAYANDEHLSDDEHQDAFAVLGDAVITALVTRRIIETNVKTKEDVTREKIELVRGDYISESARKMDIIEVIRWGKGERKQKVWEQERPLGECLESIMGAVFMDGNMEDCESVLSNIHFYSI